MNEYRQGAPYCIQIELTEGCNLRCPFCGINGIRTNVRNYKFMTLETARRIADGIKAAKWNCRLEFAMHGEPTLNPEKFQIIDIFRKALPNNYFLMESNGSDLQKNTVPDIATLFSLGLDCLALDEYEGVVLVQRIRKEIQEFIKAEYKENVDDLDGWKVGSIEMFEYPRCGPKGNPHQRKKGVRRLVFVAPISTSSSGTHATLNNHCGSGGPLSTEAQGKRCAKPFREMSFRYDGSVAVCCNDWRGVLPIGNVADSSVEELWHDPAMYSARRFLYHGKRDIGPCVGCNATSYRPGLLPDHLGKEELPEPNEVDHEIIAQAMSRGPLTQPVLRPWENQSTLWPEDVSS